MIYVDTKFHDDKFMRSKVVRKGNTERHTHTQPEQGGSISVILLFKIRKVGYKSLKIKIRIASIGPTALLQ